MFSNIGNNRRTHESPMDWEWQSHNGPTDPNSPFPQFRPHRGHNCRFTGNIYSTIANIVLANFESPKPASSSFINASSTPAPQFRNPSFTTPRKPFDPDLFSEASGAESSPADNADAEDTPDAPKASTVMTTFTSGSERKPLFGRYGADFLGNSPGRAEQRRGKFANAIQKVRKRKRVERDYSVARSHKGEFDSDSDSGPSRPSSKGKDESKPSWISNFLNGIESRPTLPHVLAYYLQLGSNLFLLSLFVFFVYTFWTAIRSDVDKATDEAKAGVMAEMAKCARDYADNFCGRNLQAPAMSSVCGAWELCMNQDPNNVGRAQVGAHTFAQIFNSFIEPISYKSMVGLSWLFCQRFQLTDSSSSSSS